MVGKVWRVERGGKSPLRGPPPFRGVVRQAIWPYMKPEIESDIILSSFAVNAGVREGRRPNIGRIKCPAVFSRQSKTLAAY